MEQMKILCKSTGLDKIEEPVLDLNTKLRHFRTDNCMKKIKNHILLKELCVRHAVGDFVWRDCVND